MVLLAKSCDPMGLMTSAYSNSWPFMDSLRNITDICYVFLNRITYAKVFNGIYGFFFFVNICKTYIDNQYDCGIILTRETKP